MSRDIVNPQLAELQSRMSKTSSADERTELVENWLKENNIPDFRTFEKEILSLFRFAEDYEKEHAVESWMAKPENNITDFGYFREWILPSFQQNSWYAVEKWLTTKNNYTHFRTWIENSSNNVTRETLAAILPLAKDDKVKKSLEKTWKEKPANDGSNRKALAKLLKNKETAEKIRISAEFFAKSENNIADFAEFEKEILPLFQLEEDKSRVLDIWLSRVENSNFENLTKVSSLLTRKPSATEDGLPPFRKDIALKWLRRPGNNNLRNLTKVLRLFETSVGIKNGMEDVAVDWLKEHGSNVKINAQTLKIILDLFDMSTSRKTVAEAFFKIAGNNNLENLRVILPLLNPEGTKIVIENWLETEAGLKAATNESVEKFKAVLPLFKEDDDKVKATKKWLAAFEGNLSAQDLKEILSPIRYADSVLSAIILGSDLQKYATLENVAAALPLTSEFNRDYSVTLFLIKNSGSENLIRLLPLVREWDRGEVVIKWLKLLAEKNTEIEDNETEKTSENIDVKNLREILLIMPQSSTIKEVVKLWVNLPSNASLQRLENASLEDLKEILPLLEDNHKIAVVEKWLAKPGNASLNNFAIIFPLLPAYRDRVVIAERWLENPENNSLENLKKLLPLLFYAHRADVAEKWLEKPENNSLDNFKEILFLDMEKESLVEKWLQKNLGKGADSKNVNLSDLKEILSLIDSDKSTQGTRNIIAAWINLSNSTFEDLKEFLPLLRDYDGEEITTNWFQKEDNYSLENLKKVLPLIREWQRYDVAEKWLKAANYAVNLQDLKEILLPIESELSRRSIITAWINVAGNNNVENLKEVLPMISEGEMVRPYMVTTWLENADDKRALKDLREILSLIKPEEKASVARSWMRYGIEKLIDGTLEDLEEILPLLSDYRETDIVEDWLKKPENNNAENFKRVLPLIPERDRKDVVTRWTKDLKNNINPKDFREILSLLKPEEKEEIARSWTQYTANTTKLEKSTLEDLKEILPLLADYIREDIAANWLDNPENNSLDNLKEVLPILRDASRTACAERWIKKPSNHSLENLKGILPLVKDEYRKVQLITNFLKNDDAANRHENLANVLNSAIVGLDKYRTDLVAQMCKDLEFGAEKTFNLCNAIYPTSEMVKADLAIRYMRDNRNSYSDEYSAAFSKFISGLEEDNVVLYLINEAKLRFQLTEVQVLNLVKGRLRSQYESVSDLLKSFSSLPDSLTTKGLETVTKLFGAENLADINLSDLLSYYDVVGNIGEFLELIKPSVKEQINQNFKTPDSKPYITSTEYWKLSILAKAAPLPETALLCDYIIKTVEIPTIAANEIDSYKLDFSGTILDIVAETNYTKEQLEEQKKKQQEVNNLFRNLLKKNDPTHEEVAAFFGAIQPEVLTLFSDKNKNDLRTAFIDDKNKIAVLLREPRGIDMFFAAVPSLSDGCTKNIGSQITKAVYSALITDPITRTVYLSLVDKVIDPILNKGGDVILNEKNPFINAEVRRSVIVPAGFLKVLREEFGNVEKGDIGPALAEFFDKTLGDKRLADAHFPSATVMDLIGDDDSVGLGQELEVMIDLACYMVLKKCAEKEVEKSVPENERFFAKILADESSKNIRARSQTLLEKTEAKIKEQVVLDFKEKSKTLVKKIDAEMAKRKEEAAASSADGRAGSAKPSGKIKPRSSKKAKPEKPDQQITI